MPYDAQTANTSSNDDQEKYIVTTEQSEPATSIYHVNLETITAGSDVLQVIVCTSNEPICARMIDAQARATQILGTLSDATIQRLSEDRTNILQQAKTQATKHRREGFSSEYGPGYTLESPEK